MLFNIARTTDFLEIEADTIANYNIDYNSRSCPIRKMSECWVNIITADAVPVVSASSSDTDTTHIKNKSSKKVKTEEKKKKKSHGL